MNHRELIAELTPMVGAGEARAIVRLVMEERFGLSQVDLLLGKDTTLSADDRTEFEKIASRLLRGEPVQYVLGVADFCGHRFRVTPDVLIPRPETEELVHWAVDELQRTSSSDQHLSAAPHILDLCTGSGCIATSLALAYPTAHVVGLDISAAAIALAHENAFSLGAKNVEFFRQDILQPTLSEALNIRNLSLLTANPPYVRASEAASIAPTVLDHEPHLALFVPDDAPLRFYHAIARIALRSLDPKGLLFVEINAALAEETRQLFLAYGFRDVLLRHDQFGHPRIIKANR